MADISNPPVIAPSTLALWHAGRCEWPLFAYDAAAGEWLANAAATAWLRKLMGRDGQTLSSASDAARNASSPGCAEVDPGFSLSGWHRIAEHASWSDHVAIAHLRAAAKDALAQGLPQEVVLSEPNLPFFQGRGVAWIEPIPDPPGRMRGVFIELSAWRAGAPGVRESAKERMSSDSANVRIRSLQSLSGAVAHHLNNILGGIAASVEFALSRGEQDLERRALMRTADAIAKAGRITHGLRVFAEGSANLGKPVPLDNVLAEQLLHFKPMFHLKGVDLTAELPKDWRPPEAPREATAAALDSIFRHYLTSLPAGARVGVGVRRETGFVVLSFNDNGPELPPGIREHLFEPFSPLPGAPQTHLEPSERWGLSAAYGILQQMGGWVACHRSEISKNTIEIGLPERPCWEAS